MSHVTHLNLNFRTSRNQSPLRSHPMIAPNAIMITADCCEPCVTELRHVLDIHLAILAMIMEHVPLQQRLGVCTSVCHAFYKAAVAATDSISITYMSSQEQCDNVSEWLQLHGGGITCLDIEDGHHAAASLKACLPCPALRDLSLQWLSVQPGYVSACTNLTRLLLKYCYLESSSATGSNLLTQLSDLCSLQHLDLSAVMRQEEYTVYLELPGSLLSQLVQLTCLKLQHFQVQSDAALQHLSALSALQHLELHLTGEGQQQPTAAALTGLQQLPQLTALKLFRVRWAINLQSVPPFTVLTALRVLHLEGSTSVDPAVVSLFSQLQHLQLDLECRDPWDAEGSAALLAAIGQQQGLVKLHISHYGCWSTPSAAAYSALTASSQLQHLHLEGCKLVAGAWQQVFQPARCLPGLSYLYFPSNWGPAQPLSQADVQAMVSCCPGLVSLALGPKLHVSSATPLQQLTGLTALNLCASFQDSAPSIAQLTGLQFLVLQSSRGTDRVTVSGLLQLTVLQQLCHVQIGLGASAWDPGLRSSLLSHCILLVDNKALGGAPPDVWLQLKSLCEAAVVPD